MRILFITGIFSLTSCASFMSQPAPVVAPEIDQVTEITNEIAAIVSTFTIDRDSSIIREDETKEKSERKTLSYTFKKSTKTRVIEVVIKIVPVKKKAHYSLVIQMISHADSNILKKIELKTTVAEELITQARNLLTNF